MLIYKQKQYELKILIEKYKNKIHVIYVNLLYYLYDIILT